MTTDLRLAFRSLLRRPGPHLVAVVVLALGIAADVLVFSLVHGMLLEPLPIQDGERVVGVFGGNEASSRRTRLGIAEWKLLREESTTLGSLAAAYNMGLSVTDSERPLNPMMRRVSRGWLELMGVQPELGRTFVEEDFAGSGRRVAILSWPFWQAQYGGDPAIVGKAIQLTYEDYEIVGVLPLSYRNPAFPQPPVLWLPMTDDAGPTADTGNLAVLGKLQPGASLAAVSGELDRLAGELRAREPERLRGFKMSAIRLHDALVEGIRPPLVALSVAVLLVLVIACANVANLLLAKALGRRDEMELRKALGARGHHLLRQLVAEGLVLGTAAAALGVGLAAAAIEPIKSLAPSNVNVPLLDQVRLHPNVLLFAAGLVVVTSLVFALLPLLRLGGSASRGRTAETVGRVQLRRGLVVAEIAVSVVLVASAGLMLRSLANLRGMPLGCEPEGVLVGRTGARGPGLDTPERWVDYHQRVIEGLNAIPGVEAAGSTDFLPMFAAGFGQRQPVEADGVGPARADGPDAVVMRATPGFFAAIGQRLLAGREVAWTDTAEAPAVAVITESLAKRLWPSGDPVGRRLAVGERNVEIVGVARDLRGLVDEPAPAPLLVVPLAQDPTPVQSFFLRTSGGFDPARLQSAAEDVVWSISRDVPVFGFTTLEQLVSDLEWRPRFVMQLLTTFALLGLALAATGVYSVLAYAVAARRREMGVRLAVGASRASVVRLVEGEVLVLAAIGVGLGVLGALGAGRLLAGELHGVSPADPATILSTAGVLTLAALLAGLAPALRAARTDPASVLRDG